MTLPYKSSMPINAIVMSTLKKEFVLNDIEAEVVYALAMHYVRNHRDVKANEMNKALEKFTIKAKQMIKEIEDEHKQSESKSKKESVLYSIIVPCKNEVKTIGNTLNILSNLEMFNTEVIVVDNSTDDSFDIIEDYEKRGLCKAYVQMVTRFGKGGALKQGLECAKGEIIVFIDADIETLKADWIYKLIGPIIRNEADVVKASYEYRNRDVVTRYIAKPLFSAFFPKITLYRPIEGEMAFRRTVLDKVKLADDLKVESQFIIDAYMNKFRIKEVVLGTKVHKERHGKSLIKLANEVQNAILEKADEYGRL